MEKHRNHGNQGAGVGAAAVFFVLMVHFKRGMVRMVIEATMADYRKAYRQHKKAAAKLEEADSGKQYNQSEWLLSFYSIECGLKYLLMQNLGIVKTDGCSQELVFLLHSHDLNKILKELHQPRFSFQCRATQKAPVKSIYVADIHQAFRYCIPLEELNDKERKKISDLEQWLEDQIS